MLAKKLMLNNSLRRTFLQAAKSAVRREEVVINVPYVQSLVVKTNFATDANEQKEESIKTEDYEKLVSQNELLVKEVAELKDKYTRSLAESENVRRRNQKMLEDSKQYSIQSFAKDLLEVADILEKAIESVPSEETKKNSHLKTLFDGVVMTEVQLQTVFKKHGVTKVHPIKEKFDPNFHEALFQLPGEESGTVAVVQKTGYRLHDRPLRAALVGVVQ